MPLINRLFLKKYSANIFHKCFVNFVIPIEINML